MTEPHGGQPRGDPAADNIKAVVDLERQVLDDASWSERFGQAISNVAGSMFFVGVQAVAMAGWIAWNTIAPTMFRFDPYPYGLLSFIVSFEGVLIATFVLMAQNRMSRQSEQREHLHLQINLLAEQELTLMLKMLRRVSERLDIQPETADDARAEKLAEETDIYDLVKQLRRELPEIEQK